MKNYFLVIVFILLGSWFQVKAQTRSTNETKVTLVVNDESDIISHIVLLNTFKKMKRKTISKKYPDSRFYMGVLRGSYDLDDDDLTPLAGTTITVYTEKQFFPEDDYFVEEDLRMGSELDLGKTRAKVISSKKGELIIQTM